MATVEEAEESLGKLLANGAAIADADVWCCFCLLEPACQLCSHLQVKKLVEASEGYKEFLLHGKYDTEVFRSFLKLLVGQLNNDKVHEHTKTRLLLVLNNCSMMKQARDEVFSASMRHALTTSSPPTRLHTTLHPQSSTSTLRWRPP